MLPKYSIFQLFDNGSTLHAVLDGVVDQADLLLRLLSTLKQSRYRFVAVTPATHARVLAREAPDAPSLRDIFGWNRTFTESQVDPALWRLMADAGILSAMDGGYRSALRVATLGTDLFFHSSFPTDDADAVFFGPDTYRFAQFITRHMHSLSPIEVVDMGAGTGAGGILVLRLASSASVTLVDTNPVALRLARLNALAAGVELDIVQASRLPSHCDIIVANPPYMMDDGDRAYRNGGALLGGELSLKWARDALGKLLPGGTLLLYTGAAYVDGNAPLLAALQTLCSEADASLLVEPIDPDVFGEELSRPPYADIERIAAVGCVIRAPS